MGERLLDINPDIILEVKKVRGGGTKASDLCLSVSFKLYPWLWPTNLELKRRPRKLNALPASASNGSC
jgi:hypothetical protein